MTQRVTALWEDEQGQLIAYALIAQPGSILTFQVDQEAHGQGLEAAILAWGVAQMQAIAQARGLSRELWCRCHESERERRAVLQAAGFAPFPERDLRLVHPLATPVSPVALSDGYSLRRGVTSAEWDAYQDLHQAVFEGIGMSLDDHQSSAYHPDPDLIAVEPSGRFAAFCQCQLKNVVHQQGEPLVGEVGVIGVRPALLRQGLGRALLLTALRQLQERGASLVFLETQETNGPARRLLASVECTTRSS